MSGDNPTFAEIAEENIRQHRSKPDKELAQLLEWERQEEHEEWLQAQEVAEKDLWVNDDGSV